MELLPISLLAILAGTLLLAKTRKEELGKFFAFVSWFFVVVGFILFIGVICKETNKGSKQCCSVEMRKGCREKKDNGATSDSTMKSCTKHDDVSKAPAK